MLSRLAVRKKFGNWRRREVHGSPRARFVSAVADSQLRVYELDRMFNGAFDWVTVSFGQHLPEDSAERAG